MDFPKKAILFPLNGIANVVYIGRAHVNTAFADHEPYQLILGTLIFYYFGKKIYGSIFGEPATRETLWAYYKRMATGYLMKLPVIGDKIKMEIKKQKESIDKSLMKVYEHEGKYVDFIVDLPEAGFSAKDIESLFERYRQLSVEKRNLLSGRISGTLYSDYHNDKERLQLLGELYKETAYTNPLHAEVFPEIRKMEAEIISCAVKLFNGKQPDACGCVTSGGTESLVLACKAYRDYARYELGIKDPEIVVPTSAHAGFDKAGQLLSIKIRHVKLDPVTMTVDLKEMRAAINSNTCLLVASSPNYPYGTIDPIEEIGKLGLQYRIPVHVDACLGGFLLAFVQFLDKSDPEVESLVCQVPMFDFQVPGVTSISADTHKYGLAPKGTSLILYSSKLYRHYQYFTVGDWPGGMYASPTIAGSRPGECIASCWSSLLYYGKNGYVNATKRILFASKKLKQMLQQVEGIFIYGQPQVSVISISSNRFNIYNMTDRLQSIGWSLNPLQSPPGFHICLTLLHTQPGVIEQLVDDIARISKQLIDEQNDENGAKPIAGPQAAIYGMSQSISDRSLINVLINQYLDSYYSVAKLAD